MKSIIDAIWIDEDEDIKLEFDELPGVNDMPGVCITYSCGNMQENFARCKEKPYRTSACLDIM